MRRFKEVVMAQNRGGNSGKGFPGKTLQFSYAPSKKPQSEPPDKKRRIESNQASSEAEFNDDMWDPLDLTHDDMNQIMDVEISMSQAPQAHQQPPARVQHSSSRSIGYGKPRSQSEGTMLSSSEKSNTSQSSSHKPSVGSSKPPYNFTSTRPKGESQAPFQSFTGGAPKSAHQAPAQTNKVSQPLSSSHSFPQPQQHGSNLNALKSQLTPLTGSTGSGQYSPALPGPHASGADSSNFAQQQISKLQKELLDLKKQNDDIRQSKCQKEGEAGILRNTLRQKDKEIERTRKENQELREKLKTEQSNKEKSLLEQNEKLETEIKFAERERDELQTRCKILEQRGLASGEGLNSPRPSSSTQVNSPQRRPQQENQSLHTPRACFPSRASFMAEESGRCTPQRQMIPEQVPGPSSKVVRPSFRKSFKITSSSGSRGKMSGPALIASILPTGASDIVAEQGMIGLLQVPLSGPTLPRMKDHNENGEDKTSQINGEISSLIEDFHESIESDPEDSQIVPHKYYSLAVQAVAKLLKAKPSCSTSDNFLLETHTEEAVFLLPAIDCYLGLYADHLNAIQAAGTVEDGESPPLSSSYSSPESYESASSHTQAVTRARAAHQRQLEKWALNALHILCVLVDFSPKVCLAVLGETMHINGSSDMDQTDVEDENESVGSSGSWSLTSDRSLTNIARRCRVFEHLIRLADPILPNKQFSSMDVVDASLRVFASLACQASPDHLMKFMPMLRKGILQQNMIKVHDYPADQLLRCHLYCVDIIKALAHSMEVLPLLCISTDECHLFTMYSMITSPEQENSSDYVIKYGLRLVQLMTVVANHPDGVALLCDENCESCNPEVVKTLTQLLYEAINMYRLEPSPACLALLQQGAALFATIAQCSRQFVHQWREVENQYVEVVLGLHSIFKDVDDGNDMEDLIQTLWDFDVEYSPNTDEPDEEMDIS